MRYMFGSTRRHATMLADFRVGNYTGGYAV